MKQGTYSILPVQIGLDVSTIEKIKFVFKQGTQKKLFFEYPSEDAYLGQDNVINLIWTQDKTFFFDPLLVEMDTFVVLKDSDINPQTQIVRFEMSPTLFKRQEIMQT